MIKIVILLLAVTLVMANKPQKVLHSNQLQVVGKASPRPDSSDFECNICLKFVSESINKLIQIFADVGISGGCSVVCGMLPGKVVSGLCDVVCDVVGIEEFFKLVNEEDPDPIYICSKARLCAHSTTAAGIIESLVVNPKNGTQGSTFSIAMSYRVTNEIATGQYNVQIIPPLGFPMGVGELVMSQKPGLYAASFKLATRPSEQDPFPAGVYQVQAAICEGQCGSPHEWSKTLSIKTTNFTLTQGQGPPRK